MGVPDGQLRDWKERLTWGDGKGEMGVSASPAGLEKEIRDQYIGYHLNEHQIEGNSNI